MPCYAIRACKSLCLLLPYNIHSAYCTCAYMHRRTCANARVVSCVSRTCTAFCIFTGDRTPVPVRDWPPRTNILSLRYIYMASQVSSIHFPYHNVNKFVLIVSDLPRAKFSQQTKLQWYVLYNVLRLRLRALGLYDNTNAL